MSSTLEKNNTWEIVDKLEVRNRKIISSKLIFTIKPEGRLKLDQLQEDFYRNTIYIIKKRTVQW